MLAHRFGIAFSPPTPCHRSWSRDTRAPTGLSPGTWCGPEARDSTLLRGGCGTLPRLVLLHLEAPALAPAELLFGSRLVLARCTTGAEHGSTGTEATGGTWRRFSWSRATTNKAVNHN